MTAGRGQLNATSMGMVGSALAAVLTTRVVMLTSKDSTIDKVRGMMAGTDVYLTKPVDRIDLIRAIDKCLPRVEFSRRVYPTTGARGHDFSTVSRSR